MWDGRSAITTSVPLRRPLSNVYCYRPPPPPQKGVSVRLTGAALHACWSWPPPSQLRRSRREVLAAGRWVVVFQDGAGSQREGGTTPVGDSASLQGWILWGFTSRGAAGVGQPRQTKRHYDYLAIATLQNQLPCAIYRYSGLLKTTGCNIRTSVRFMSKQLNPGTRELL